MRDVSNTAAVGNEDNVGSIVAISDEHIVGNTVTTSNEYDFGNAVIVSNEWLVILLRCEVKTMLATQLLWRMEQSAVAVRVTEIAEWRQVR